MEINSGSTSKAVLSFIVIIIALVAVSILYLSMHAAWDGRMYAKLSDEDKTAVTLMLKDTTQAADSKKQAFYFIRDKLSPVDTSELYESYKSLSNLDLIGTLPSIRVETYSYFWLVGEGRYLEVIFWAIFGVMTSLLYFASEAMRLEKFRDQEISVYFAKIFYAPFIALIIVFFYNELTTTDNITFEDSTLEIIVFSFIIGFFSGRAIEFLNKIKEVIMPGRDVQQDLELNTIILTGRVSAKNDDIDFTASKARITLISSVEQKELTSVETNTDRVYVIKNITPGSYNIKAELISGADVYSAVITDKKLKKESPVEIENIELIKSEAVN